MDIDMVVLDVLDVVYLGPARKQQVEWKFVAHRNLERRSQTARSNLANQ